MNKDGSLFGVAVFTLGYVAVTYAAGKLFSKALARASSSSNTDEDDMRFRLDKRPSSPRGPSSKKRKSKVASQLEEAEEDEEEDVDVSLLHEHWAGDIPPELEEVIDILKYPEIYAQMGSSMPKGIILHGDPGTGKTYFAKVLAEVTGSHFFYAAASQFDEIYVGRGPQRIRQLFEEAKQAAAQHATDLKKNRDAAEDVDAEESENDDDEDSDDDDNDDNDGDASNNNNNNNKNSTRTLLPRPGPKRTNRGRTPSSRSTDASVKKGWLSPSWWWSSMSSSDNRRYSGHEGEDGDEDGDSGSAKSFRAQRSTSTSSSSNPSVQTETKLPPIGQHMSIIFIDEIDALGSRGGPTVDARHATLSQLLVCMDGMNSADNVFVIAATNNLSLLDPALIRSGRFDRIVKMALPAERSRAAILRFYLKNKPGLELLEEHGVVNRVAAVTRGFNCGDLKSLVNEASLAATRVAIERQKQLERKRGGGGGSAGKKHKASKRALENLLVVDETHLLSAFQSVYTKIMRERPQNELLTKRQVTDILQSVAASNSSPSADSASVVVADLPD